MSRRRGLSMRAGFGSDATIQTPLASRMKFAFTLGYCIVDAAYIEPDDNTYHICRG